MRSAKIPAWVKRGILARHIPSNVLFWIGDAQESITDRQICLCDFPPDGDGTRYPIEECELGSIAHFRAVAIVSQNGTLISAVRESADPTEKDQRDRVIFYTDDQRVTVRIDRNAFCDPTVMSAAESIANLFPGSVIGRYEEVF